MERVKLITSHNELVAYVQIPLFGAWPDVLIWGQRFFQRLSTKPPGYQECFVWAVQETMSTPETSPRP